MTRADPDDERPRVIAARFGANPNSSSLGVDVTFLLFGGTAVLAISVALGAFLRSRKRAPEGVGELRPAPPGPSP